MDTDCFVYWIESEDYYKDIKDDTHQWFDTSKYEHSKSGIELNVNKKMIDKFKDETGDKVLPHSVALRSKLYSSFSDNESSNTINKVKSIKK